MKYTLLTERTCAMCGSSKQSDQFYTKNGEPIGYCKPCKKEYALRYKRTAQEARDYYNENRDRILSNRRTLADRSMKARISRIVRNSKQRSNKIGLDFDIDFDFCLQLYEDQNGLCALSGEKLELSGDRYLSNMMSLDRIDSDKGYVKGNIQWVCVKYNMMKAHATMEEFLKMCRTITEFNT